MSRQNHPIDHQRFYPWKKNSQSYPKNGWFGIPSFPFSDGGGFFQGLKTVDGHLCRGSRSPGKCHTHRRRNSEPTLVQFQLPKKTSGVIVVCVCLRFFFPIQIKLLGGWCPIFLFHSYLGGLHWMICIDEKMSYSCYWWIHIANQFAITKQGCKTKHTIFFGPFVKDDDVDMDEGLLLAERLTSAVTWRF